MDDKLTPQEQQTNWETSKHIQNVQHYIFRIIAELILRAERHDQSKLKNPEVEYFTQFTSELRGTTYGSPEYYELLKKLQPALDHHYANNSHHPEAHTRGIDDMSLIDLIEMIADWKAASLRHANGDITRSIEINKDRFSMSPQLVDIFKNTVRDLSLETE